MRQINVTTGKQRPIKRSLHSATGFRYVSRPQQCRKLNSWPQQTKAGGEKYFCITSKCLDMFPQPEIHIFIVWCVRFICDNLALPVPCHWERINTDEPYQVLHLLKWTSLLHSDGCDVAAHPAGTRHPRVQRGGPPVWKDHGSSHQIHPEDSELGFMGILLQVWVETLMSLLPGTSSENLRFTETLNWLWGYVQIARL